MSLLTRCPACETLYKLVPDQLRISQGWVKCGQCGEIFDASKHLIQVAVEPATLMPEANSAESSVSTAGVPFVEDVAAEIRPVVPVETQLEQPSAKPAGVTLSEVPYISYAGMTSDSALVMAVEPRTETLDKPAPLENNQQAPVANVLCAIEAADAEFQAVPMSTEPTTDTTPMMEQSQVPDSVQELPKISFLGDSERRSVWQTRSGKFVLWLFLTLLSAGLWLQWLYWERNRLAASYPNLKPLLQQICQPLRCSLQPLQRIDAIAVDSATFNRVDSESYRLSFVIKNLSKLAVALPSVELTLTDTQEQVIVRRALVPQELFALAPTLSPGTELPVNLLLGLDLGDATPRVVGYRLLAFYP